MSIEGSTAAQGGNPEEESRGLGSPAARTAWRQRLGQREARLRQEYAGDYPGITPNVWMPVSELAQSLVARTHARRREGRYTRTFDPTHFEFRGGDTAPRPRISRTRSTDPPE